ncbi:radical SAM protein [Candidatus Marsarchaeota archaeon]|nr:radical SAM protein [Candidatus Marsarchaeota archaeon]MCL5092436.1 radical SAM protein [Candidatus Marsarchaeota archaeon]
MAIIKLAGLGKAALESNFKKLDKPYKLNFAITYWCQSRCLTCNIWQFKPKGELTIDEIRTFAKKNTSFKWIELTGGEPFLRPDIVEIAKTFYENSRGLYILTMPTNSLCSHDLIIRRIKEMLDIGIPRIAITISLDGYRELHDKIRGIPGNYDRAITTFKRLHDLQKDYKNLYFVFGYTMSGYNEGQFQRTLDAVKNDIPYIKYKDFHMNLGQISSNYYGNSNLDMLAKRKSVADELENIIGKRERDFGVIPRIEHTFLKKLVEYVRTDSMPMKSKSLDASLFLDSFGNIFPSIMWDQKVGNVRDIDYDLGRVWHSELANSIRDAIDSGKEPKQWTSCEAYQSITGNMTSLIK